MSKLKEDGVLAAKKEDGFLCYLAEEDRFSDGLVDCDGLHVLLVEGGVGRGTYARDWASHDGGSWRPLTECG